MANLKCSNMLRLINHINHSPNPSWISLVVATTIIIPFSLVAGLIYRRNSKVVSPAAVSGFY